MARKADSGWRDSLLTVRHRYYGFEAPAAGMVLPMIEYDRGKAVGVVSYHRVGTETPKGSAEAAAHRAFGKLVDGNGLGPMPFLTAFYDPCDWSMAVFPHNDAAKSLVGRSGWLKVAERDFAALLYKMRGRVLPDLSPYGVTWNETMRDDGYQVDPGESWPGQAMSERRRGYEPTLSVPFRLRVPCLDVDLAVIDESERVAALVDYKAKGNRNIELDHANFKALASITTDVNGATSVPAFVVEYMPVKPAWEFRVHCLNASARLLLAYALGATNASVAALAHTVAGDEWVFLSEAEWTGVLRCARDV
jgi:hypothetical protein